MVSSDMNSRGSVLIEVLVLLATVIATSIAVLLLVQFRVIDVSADAGAVGSDAGKEVLNANFLPVAQEDAREESILAVKDFEFCADVDENFNCLGEKKNFMLGNTVHFVFRVETTAVQNKIALVQNYRLIDPKGRVVLEADEQRDFHFNLQTGENTAAVVLKDYFIAGYEMPEGEYLFELHLENPILNKRVKVVKKVGIYSYLK